MAEQFEKVVGTRLHTHTDKQSGTPVINCIISTQKESTDDARNSHCWGVRCSEYWIRSDHAQFQEAQQLKDKDFILPLMNGRWCNGFLVKGKI